MSTNPGFTRAEIDAAIAAKTSANGFSKAEIEAAIAQKQESKPSFIGSIVSDIGSAGKQVVSNPSRAGRVAVAGGLNDLQTLATKIAPFAIGPAMQVAGQKETPQIYDTRKALRTGPKQAGDDTLAGLPMLLGPTSEVEGANLITRLLARGAEGYTYAEAANADPTTGTILSALLPEVPTAGKAIGQEIKRGGTKVKNATLDYLNKQSSIGNALTPEETSVNLLRNYLSKEGETLPVDIGSATQNPTLSNIYGTSSKLPFSGGKKQTAQLKAAMRDTATAKAMAERDKIASAAQKELATAQQVAAQGAGDYVGLQDKSRELYDKIGNTSSQLERDRTFAADANESLNHLSDKGFGTSGEKMKGHLKNAFEDVSTQSRANYGPVNDFNVPIGAISRPEEFVNYRAALNKFNDESENLKAFFGDDKDLGSQLSREIKRGENFFVLPGKQEKSSVIELPSNYVTKGGEANTKSILEHVRNLQQLGATAKGAGKFRESSVLFGLANALKTDYKEILAKNGYGDVAQALENADKFHQEAVLPFYGNREISKTVTDKNHIPNAVKVSQTLHNPNYTTILDRLPQVAKNSTLYHMITKGKGTAEGVSNMGAEEVAKSYASIPAEHKGKINEYHSVANKYFEDLTGATQRIKESEKEYSRLLKENNRVEKQLTAQDKTAAQIEKAQGKIDRANENFYDFVGKKYPSPDTRIGAKPEDAVKAVGGAKAALLGAAALLHPRTIAAIAGLGPTIGKKVNKALTDPELLNKYLNREKYDISARISPKQEEYQRRLAQLARLANENPGDQ